MFRGIGSGLFPLYSSAALPFIHDQAILAASRVPDMLSLLGNLIIVSMVVRLDFRPECMAYDSEADKRADGRSLAVESHQYPARSNTRMGLGIAPLGGNSTLIVRPPKPFNAFVHSRASLPTRPLSRYWPEVCLQEGEVWFAAGEYDLAKPWAEALRRARNAH
jgi:hypothetical protein